MIRINPNDHKTLPEPFRAVVLEDLADVGEIRDEYLPLKIDDEEIVLYVTKPEAKKYNLKVLWNDVDHGTYLMTIELGRWVLNFNKL